MKERIKALWKLCFNDSDEFIEMYFRLRYSTDVNIAIESEGKVISALQMIPYPMTFGGDTVRSSYISGACTHPDFRGGGVMRELLTLAFHKMRNSGVSLSTLIPAEPWLFDYYARLGYAPVFKHVARELDVTEFAPSEDIIVSPISEYQEEVYHYANHKLSERPYCVQHTAEDFKVIMSDLATSGDFLYVARRNDVITGIAVVYKEESDQVSINELLADNKEVEHSLIHFIKAHSGCVRMVRLSPVDSTFPAHSLPTHSFGMVRMIDTHRVLRLYAAAFPEDEMLLEVHDDQLTANNGYYRLRKGECVYSVDRLPGTAIQMSISELASRILTPLHPYMSLMLN